jgi:hypothetical protein
MHFVVRDGYCTSVTAITVQLRHSSIWHSKMHFSVGDRSIISDHSFERGWVTLIFFLTEKSDSLKASHKDNTKDSHHKTGERRDIRTTRILLAEKIIEHNSAMYKRQSISAISIFLFFSEPKKLSRREKSEEYMWV